MKIFDSTFFWLIEKFNDDPTLIGSRQLIIITLAEILYIMEAILLVMFLFLPIEIRQEISPYGKVVLVIGYFILLKVNHKRYNELMKENFNGKIYKNDLIYYIILFFPVLLPMALFIR